MVFISKLRGVKVNVPQRSVAFFLFSFLFFVVAASIKIVLSKRLLLYLNEEVSQLPYLGVFFMFFLFFFFYKSLVEIIVNRTYIQIGPCNDIFPSFKVLNQNKSQITVQQTQHEIITSSMS